MPRGLCSPLFYHFPNQMEATLNLLLVEDHEMLARMTVEILQAMGHSVQHAPNGPLALQAVESSLPDLALIDIGMPIMSGYELAKRLRADPRCESVVLVALTGYASEKDREKALMAGFDAHFAKPMDFNILSSIKRRMPGTMPVLSADQSVLVVASDDPRLLGSGALG